MDTTQMRRGIKSTADNHNTRNKARKATRAWVPKFDKTSGEVPN